MADLEVDDFSDAFPNFEVDGFAAFPAVVLSRGWGLMNFVKLGPPAIWKMKTKGYQCALYQLQEPPYAKEKKHKRHLESNIYTLNKEN